MVYNNLYDGSTRNILGICNADTEEEAQAKGLASLDENDPTLNVLSVVLLRIQLKDQKTSR